jgi:hypothetical protein
MLAKEIAVPMPLLLVFLPAGDRKTRRRYAIAHLGALAIYFAWRRAVLGTWLGSYGWVVQSDEWARLLILLPWRVVTAAAGSNLVIGLGLIGIMAVVAAAGVRSRGVLPLVLAGLLVAIAPLVPVAREVNRRYVVVPWLAASILFAAGARALGGRRSAILLTAVPLAAVIANREEWADEYRVRRQMSEEARFFTEMPPNGMLRAPLTPPAAMQELNWLKVVRLRRPAGAAWFYDDYYLCVKDPAGRRMWQYDGAVKSMIEITNNAPAIARRHCRSIRDGVPLSARFRYEQPAALYWSLGPYDDGTYTVLLGNGVQSFRVNRNDALNVPASALALRIRYDSPQGWTTYSPELTLDLSKNMETAWQR